MQIDLLHQGFDGLELAFKAHLKSALIKIFEHAREQAGAQRSPQLLHVEGRAMHVLESGARGGYRYICDTGPLGATWFFKVPSLSDPWGVRVSAKSLPLALIGIRAVEADFIAFVTALCGELAPNAVSLGRVDYCLDFLIPDFDLKPDQFVMHSRLTRAADREASEVGRSGRASSIRIGKMPGQQVAVYDKRSDVMAKSKAVWWEIWNANRAAQGLPPIAPDTTQRSLWRVELRAGKNYLKKRKGITTLDHFLRVGGSLFSEMAEGIRYVSPADDTNRARWPSHPLWLAVQSNLAAGLREMTDALPASRVREIASAELVEILDKQIFGCEATLIAALDLADVEPSDLARFVSDRLRAQIDSDPGRFRRKIVKATERYFFLDDPAGVGPHKADQ